MAPTKLRTAITLSGLALLQGLGVASGSARPHAPALRLPGRSISVRIPARLAEDNTDTDLTVTVTDTSSRPLVVSRTDFELSAQGDMFVVGQWSYRQSATTIAPRRSDGIRLTFGSPISATQGATLVYKPRDRGPAGLIPLPAATAARQRVTRPPSPPIISTFQFSQAGADPWGTAIDRAGNVWFAVSECDFGPTCPVGTPPGQIGELKRSSHAIVRYPLPDIPGNQPIFPAFDRSGNLWFTTPGNSKIGEFRPSTRRFVGQWSVTPGSGPWDLTFSGRTIWYTEHFVSAVGSFSPTTHRNRDFSTPSANSNPYGIVANHGLIWFTENNSGVDRVAVLNARNRNHVISEYPIVSPPAGTPHMITIGRDGHPWWTEGWSNTIATLNPAVARPGRCGPSLGVCRGITRFALPVTTTCSTLSHVSGIAFDRSRRLVWLDDSLTAQVGSFDPQARSFSMITLSDCDAHPHDGLILGAGEDVWFDQEFDSALGELVP